MTWAALLPDRIGSDRGQNALHAAAQPRPALLLERQLPSARLRDRVEPRLAVLLREAPLRPQPSVLGHAVERGIERAFLDAQKIRGHALDARGDRVPVHPAAVAQGLEDA